MGKLSQEDKARYYLSNQRLYEYSCDEVYGPHKIPCGALIPTGALFITKKYKEVKDKNNIKHKEPELVRCMQCEYLKNPLPETVKVRGAGKGVKVSAETAAGITLDPIVRKAILKLLKASPEGVPVDVLKTRLMKRKVIRALKKKTIAATIRSMRKLKLFKKKGLNFVLPVEKTKKKKKKVKAKA